MPIALTTPITGSAQTGFTTPGYTIVQGTAPDVNAKQWYCSALTGTQAGVTTHSASSPFTFTWWQPKGFKRLPKANPMTGVISNIPKNVFLGKVRKGAVPLAGQSPEVIELDVRLAVPAGVDTANPAEIRAAISACIGMLTQVSAAYGDSVVLGQV